MTEQPVVVIITTSELFGPSWVKQRFMNLLQFECCCVKGAELGVKICPDCAWVSNAWSSQHD